MAKQTFTTGQVLTAAQMTSLQQTAMGGGSATTKTASYTLVAADAGTTVTMTSASATTITVNTSLFAAGDTVYIQNLGVGVSTITAGTATVNTSATLALAQYEGGQLYFVSTSASIFLKGDGAAASGGGMTLLSTTTLSGATVTVSSIDQTYNILYGVITGMTNATGDGYFACNPNGDTTLGINSTHYMNSAGDGAFGGVNSPQDLYFGPVAGGNSVRKRTDADNSLSFFFYNYASTTDFKSYIAQGTFINPGTSPAYGANTPFGTSGAYKSNSAIASLVMKNTGGNLSTGTLKLYGVK